MKYVLYLNLLVIPFSFYATKPATKNNTSTSKDKEVTSKKASPVYKHDSAILALLHRDTNFQTPTL